VPEVPDVPFVPLIPDEPEVPEVPLVPDVPLVIFNAVLAQTPLLYIKKSPLVAPDTVVSIKSSKLKFKIA
jgi:hypothetical protein